MYEPDYDGYNVEAKNFFTQFFKYKNNKKYKKLLRDLFPNVENFLDNKKYIIKEQEITPKSPRYGKKSQKTLEKHPKMLYNKPKQIFAKGLML